MDLLLSYGNLYNRSPGIHKTRIQNKDPKKVTLFNQNSINFDKSRTHDDKTRIHFDESGTDL